MYFSKIFATIGAASIMATANAGVIQKRGLTASEIVDNINVITTMSQDLQAPANSINILSGPLFLIGQGPFPTIIIGFSDIITTVNGDLKAMEGAQPFSVLSDEQSILDAFKTFVLVHQELLSILIGKAGLLNDLPLVGPPVAGVLRSLEAVVDSIALSLINLCPDVSDSLVEQQDSIDNTLNGAITAYTPAI